MTFKEAIKATPGVEDSWQEGLQALRSEDRPHIHAETTRNLRGSADIDAALQRAMPGDNRWDFGIAYQHSGRKDEVVYWVELHTASDSEFKVVMRKAEWLKKWLREWAPELAKLEREIVWVSSGATPMTVNSQRKRQLAAVGVRHVGSHLRIKNRRD